MKWNVGDRVTYHGYRAKVIKITAKRVTIDVYLGPIAYRRSVKPESLAKLTKLFARFP